MSLGSDWLELVLIWIIDGICWANKVISFVLFFIVFTLDKFGVLEMALFRLRNQNIMKIHGSILRARETKILWGCIVDFFSHYNI